MWFLQWQICVASFHGGVEHIDYRKAWREYQHYDWRVWGEKPILLLQTETQQYFRNYFLNHWVQTEWNGSFLPDYANK